MWSARTAQRFGGGGGGGDDAEASTAHAASKEANVANVANVVSKDDELTPEMKEKRYPDQYRDFTSTETFATWMTMATFLVSFGVTIDATVPGGEPVGATAMEALGIAFVLCVSYVYFKSNWNILERPKMIGLLVLTIFFLMISIFLTVRIWVKVSVPSANNTVAMTANNTAAGTYAANANVQRSVAKRGLVTKPAKPAKTAKTFITSPSSSSASSPPPSSSSSEDQQI